MTGPSPPSSPPGRDLSTSGDRRRRESRRVLAWSLGFSALVHLLAIALYQLGDGIPAGSLPPPVPTRESPPPEGLLVLNLVEMPPGEEPDDPLQPEEEEPAEPFLPGPPPGAPAPPGGVPTAPPGEEERAPRTAAELLRPTLGDPDLWVFRLPELSDQERYRLQLEGRLEAWQDSVMAEMERARQATDWTYTDDDGNRWGISPGRIHLGSFSLPLPLGFATPPGLRDEIERRGWEWDEIQRGAASGVTWETWQERAREIRQRREAERADTLPPF